jgi:carbon storage regulator
MLVFTRRSGEAIVIDRDVTVTVLSVQGGKVRLGIQAPTAVRVDRHEIHVLRARREATRIQEPLRAAEPALTGPPGAP